MLPLQYFYSNISRPTLFFGEINALQFDYRLVQLGHAFTDWIGFVVLPRFIVQTLVVIKIWSLGTPESRSASPTLFSFLYKVAVSMCLYPILRECRTAFYVSLPGWDSKTPKPIVGILIPLLKTFTGRGDIKIDLVVILLNLI